MSLSTSSLAKGHWFQVTGLSLWGQFYRILGVLSRQGLLSLAQVITTSESHRSHKVKASKDQLLSAILKTKHQKVTCWWQDGGIGASHVTDIKQYNCWRRVQQFLKKWNIDWGWQDYSVGERDCSQASQPEFSLRDGRREPTPPRCPVTPTYICCSMHTHSPTSKCHFKKW